MPYADPRPGQLPREAVAEAEEIRRAVVSFRGNGGFELAGYLRYLLGTGRVLGACGGKNQEDSPGLPHASTARAARRSVASPQGFAASCTPSGSPCSPSPQGTLIAGQPSALNRFVRSVEAGMSNSGATPG